MKAETVATRSNTTIGVLRAALVMAVLVPAALFVLVAWQNRREIERGAEEQARHTAFILREHALKVMETAELALSQTDASVRGLDWGAVEQSPEVHDFLNRLDEQLSQIALFALIDPEGVVRATSKSFPLEHRDEVGASPFFKALRAAPAGTPSGQVARSLLAGVDSFSIARRRSSGDGRFDGVIAATVDPAYFRSFYRSVIGRDESAIALILADGTVLAREPPVTAVLGPQSGFMQAIAGGGAGSYRAVSGVDGVPRIFGYARIGDYPLYVTFGLSERSVIGQWRGNLLRFGSFAALAALALTAISWLALRRALELQESEERYRTLYVSTPVPMHTLDASGRIQTVTDQWLEFFGYGREEVIGRPIHEFHTARSAREFHEWVWPQTLRGEPLRHVEREFVRKDGEIVYALLSARAELDTDGTVKRVRAVIVDISSRKRAEQELRREKELSGFLLKSSTEGIAGVDRDFRVTIWNPAMSGILGLAPHEALGHDLFELFPRFRLSSVETALRQALTGRRSEESDRSYTVPATGERGYYEARYAPIFGEEGGIIGAVVLMRDTTERRQMEETLRQSQKMEAVGQLTGGIAHDFNNLLTVIVGNLQLVAANLPDLPKLRRQIEAAQRAADRGARLTAQLLTFSRRQSLRPEVRDIGELIREFRNLTQRAAGDAIGIEFHLQPGGWSARIDPAQFEAAVLNLVVNARDAIAGQGSIVIETTNLTLRVDNNLGMPPGDYVRVSVTDDGAGMPPEVLARASEPFFTTKDVGKGTGLGLSMVYGFLRQSGGEMRITSEVGQGTRVDMYLPRSVEAPTRPAPSIAVAPADGSGTILLVDDDADVRDAAAAMLRASGYDVIAVADAADALDRLRADREIDLLLTDIIMPGGMSGADLARRVRQEFPRMRILLTSGHSLPDARVAAGADLPVIPKPFTQEQLVAALRAVLAGTPAQSSV